MADFSGDAGNNTLTGTSGDDTLRGLGGNDSLDGGLGNDSLVGGDGDDTLRGNAGSDTMEGGAGNDRYLVESAGDLVTELAGEGTDTVLANLSYTLGANVENLTLTGALNLIGQGNELDNTLTGNTGNDSLVGLAGNDTLISGGSADTLVGGTGNDVYTVNSSGDVVVENATEGTDTVSTSVSYTLGANVENLTLTGSSLSGTGNTLANVITGTAGNNSIYGLAGNDTLNAGAGNDSLQGGDGLDTLYGGVGLDTLVGGNGNDSLLGNAGNDSLDGGAGSDALDGGAGNDTLAGGVNGDSYYVDSSADVVVEGTDVAVDWVYSTATTYTLSSNVENLQLQGSGNLSGTGNSGNNVLAGNTGDNTLVGGAGNDTFYGSTGADVMQGGLGDDSYAVDELGDSVTEASSAGTDTVRAAINYTLGSNLENLVLGNSSDLTGVGNTLNNTITGNSGNNYLDGKSGDDVLVGGDGSDTYVVDASGDVVTESGTGSADQVNAAVSYVLGSNVENLVLTGTSNLAGTGNTLNNLITGNSGSNSLSGGTGADTLVGGLGHDTYVVNSADDTVTESSSSGGTDLVESSVSYTLTTNVDNLTLTGSTGLQGTGNTLDNYITGTSANDTLIGDSGHDTLRGMAGTDSLQGGTGDDVYMVNEAGDVAVENAGEGTDRVLAVASYTLSDNIEQLVLVSGTINGTGNDLDNTLTGNDSANALDGGTGADAMAGAGGNDTYTVDNAGDVTTELAGGGTDLVRSSVNWTLSSQVENLTLTGSTGLQGVGNELNNIINGTSGDDTLDGGAGADTLIGGAGNDSYVVNLSTDVVTEAATSGDDTVSAAVNYTLGSNLENLYLSGLDLNGTGNADDNRIVGTSSANLLDGAAGSDDLVGGDGNDTYVVDAAGDTVTELDGEGTDQVNAAVNWTLGDFVEDLLLTGSDTLEGTGNTLDNMITGNSAGNRLDGGSAGNDTLVGGAGNDTYVAGTGTVTIIEWAGQGTDWVESAASYTLASTLENLLLTGSSAIDGTGNSAANILEGNSADNVLNGKAGQDTLIGHAGDDTYRVDSASDVVTEAAGEGTDLVEAEVSYTLGNNLENLVLVDNGSNLSGTGNAEDNDITGNGADNWLDGGTGADNLTGGDGNDTYVVNSDTDSVTEAAGEGTADEVQASIDYTLGVELENLTLTGSSDLNGTGNSLDNVITGNSGNNSLVGAGGDDTFVGGDGDDTYQVDSGAAIISELAGEGTDEAQASVSYTLAAQVEDLVLKAGAGNIDGTGNTLANNITGNEGDNLLDGVSGVDSLTGGGGNDTYVVNSSDDQTTEAVGEGVDLVESSVSWTLGDNLDNLTLTGTANIDGTGNELVNVITGNTGNNKLDGGTGADDLTAGAGDDTYVVDDAGDAVTESAAEGTDEVQASVDYTLGSDLENLTLTGADDLLGTGNTLNNIITGNSGANLLDGVSGEDSFAGGAGDDTYTVNDSGDVVTEDADAGHDLVNSSVSWTLEANVEDLTLTGSADVDGTGNDLVNVITGNSGNNSLNGGAGADELVGAAGNDTYVVDNAGDTLTENASEGTDEVQSSVTWTLAGEFENLVLTGSADIDGTGNTVDNNITGNSGANKLDGGTGADAMAAGAGNDTYVVDDAGDSVIEDADAGTDLVESSIDYTLSVNLENLTLTGSGNLVGKGNSLDNVITGNSGNNALDGDTGADSFAGGAGDDTYTVNSTTDVVTENLDEGTDLVNSSVTWTLGDNVEDLTLTGTDNIKGYGNALVNTITGNSGDNVLDGAAGADVLVGGAGNDTYIVDDASESLTEGASAGQDKVKTSVSWTLGANFEDLVLTGTSSINGTGNGLDNYITGNAGANLLDGDAGADTLFGGNGNDTYVVDNAGDSVIENAPAGGVDLVRSGVSYTLGTNLENLTLTGSSNIDGLGNTLNNVITGNDGNNTLDGGTGSDSLAGGLGDDTYVVNSSGDQVTEAADEGTDLVNSSVSWTLSANVDNLTLTGTDAINGTGNDLDNTITGNDAANILTGGAGTDVLAGGLGDDTYVVDGGETINESSSAGTDRVQSSISWTLGSNLEQLELTGVNAIDGTGNSLDNLIIGNSAANVLDGGTGADSLQGGQGNDTYYVDDAGDVLTEAASAGTDLVHSSITWVLGSNLENLTLDGASDINGAGNSLDNIILGNTGNNKLVAGAGNDSVSGGDGTDTLQGGEGSDVLDGGAGDDVIYTGTAGGDNAADTVLFGEGVGNDTVYAYATTSAAADTIVLDSTLTTGELVVSRNGGDLVLGSSSTSDTLTVKSFFSYSETGEFTVGSIEFDDGTVLSYEDILAQTLIGTGGDDVLVGYATDDLIQGNAGNDTLHGHGGSDTLNGGTGDDVIYTGTVSEVDNEADTIVYAVGDGSDVIYSSASTLAGSDIIQLGAGIAQANLAATQDGLDLVLDIGGTGTLTIDNFFSDAYTVHSITLDGGSSLDLTNATVLNDLLHATATAIV